MSAAKNVLRKLLYRTGVLGLMHRLRNRHTLTVFMFHRVLHKPSVEYQNAEKEFTFTVEGFRQCLDFIQQHYRLVSQAEVTAYLNGQQCLPQRAGLITFDDGWRDTLFHALPELKKRGLPAVLFLATEVVDLQANDWWQDVLVELIAQEDGLNRIESAIEAVRESALDADKKSVLVGRRQSAEDHTFRLRRVTATLAAMDESQRQAILQPLVPRSPGARQMLTRADLDLLHPLITIAGHGHSHAPLSHHPHASDDLAACRAQLQAIGGEDTVMSFPHGAYDQATLKQAQAAGFRVCYSSDPILINTARSRPMQIPLGRIHIPENEWTCNEKGIAAEKMATFLFFRPAETLKK
ncbi:MAG: polysaccharide deacetylase family protein [Rugosibacter sp.]|jgi:peptidoglycan/xylan/chitin deacetylase (PgdA/CDA1 family)